jgi:ADP-glucose pyrophosphorylase
MQIVNIKYQIVINHTPVFIGSNCVIENSVIGQGVITDGAVVSSTIMNSLIYDNVHAIDAELDDAIIGPEEIITGQHRKIVKTDSVIVEF